MCITKTERLYIRKCTENDYKYYAMLYGSGNSPLAKWFKDSPETFEEVCYNIFKKCSDEIFLIFRKDTNEFCGQLELRNDDNGGKELGIDFLPEQQNKGFGTESIIGFSNWLYRERDYSHLTIRIDPENNRSQHVFKKLGAIFVEQKSVISSDLAELMKNSGINYNELGLYYYTLPLPIKNLNKEIK